jgi:hypothetical protein
MKSILIGKKGKPTYLVEIEPKKLTIYKPDRHSKQEDFYEQYVLGEVVLSTPYDKILFTKAPIAYRRVMDAPNLLYAMEMNIVVKKKQIRVSTSIRMVPFLQTRKKRHTK